MFEIFDGLRNSKKSQVESSISEDPASIPVAKETTIPLPPVSKPQSMPAGYIHEMAYNSDHPLTPVAQKLFENHGVIPPNQVQELADNGNSVVERKGMFEIDPSGSITSQPIIDHFNGDK
jgi:hypothetical protein